MMVAGKEKLRIIAGVVFALAVIAGGAGAGIVVAGGGGEDQPITGAALEKASKAALEHTGGGRVTGTEVGDEESYYEVEVTLDNGSQVDVQLNENFNVVGQEGDNDGADDQDGPNDD